MKIILLICLIIQTCNVKSEIVGRTTRKTTTATIEQEESTTEDNNIYFSHVRYDSDEEEAQTTTRDKHQPKDCGVSKNGRQTIVGGNYIRRGSYPWHAALINSGKLFCGATLVSNKTVVTAAHCIKGKGLTHQFNASDIIVSLGVHDLSASFERKRVNLGVKAIHLHPDWNVNLDPFDADIAILELEDEIKFNDHIQQICLEGNGSPIEKIFKGVVVGFGRSENIERENKAKELSIPIVDFHKCSESDDHKHLISSRTFCGGTEDGKGVCDGDSGGGVYVVHNQKYYLRGIVSASLSVPETGCNVHKHAVFTKATDFYYWIKSGGTRSEKLTIEYLLNLLSKHNITVPQ